ncbi:EamA family transporter [Bartonella tamiae]|uniref:EamA domain-containing protein n=1 Tax=Bartonella tamiae Th239 TaxID=1094558 RepID=J1JWA5_9HYPH|nr:EamA family transporter [Bartonella tamiae]EJF89287.1 hypothetical protein ME5_01838 [Bartonella tamiae Th239]EJF95551.1 hypothetical protein MEG_00041 [Bartonella tamiae Th307]
MSWLVFVLWLSNIVCDTVGQLAFKAAAIEPQSDKPEDSYKTYWFALLKKPVLWLGVGAYIAEFLLWLAFLTLVPLSEGILLGSINIIVIMILGRFLFNEKLTNMRVIGISLVAIGVAIVGAT